MKRVDFISSAGFSLIELVVAILILAIAAAGIIALNGNLYLRSNDIEKIQNSSLMVQACADRVVGIRKSTTDVSALTEVVLSASCQALPKLDSNITLSVKSVTVSSLCLSPLTCAQFEIKATATGFSSPAITLLFSNY